MDIFRLNIYAPIPMTTILLIDTIILFYSRYPTEGWIAILFLLGLGYIGFKLTNGLIIGYMKSDMSDDSKSFFLIIHGIASVILAFYLPNNFLNRFEFFKLLYEKHTYWIGITILLLLIIFLMLIGIFISLVFKKKKE